MKQIKWRKTTKRKDLSQSTNSKVSASIFNINLDLEKNMFEKFFIIIFMLLISIVSIVNAQQPKRTPYPESKYNREPNEQRLKKISMRLELTDDYFNKKSITKFPKEKDIYLQIFAKSKDPRIIALGLSKLRFFIPLLFDNKGNVIPYTKTAQEKLREEWKEVKRRKSPNAFFRDSDPSDFIGEKETRMRNFNIAFWYGKIEAGNYKVAVSFGFGESENEKKIKSNVVKFRVY